MKLAIETATEVCSVALELDNKKILEKRVTGKGMHSEKLFQFIELLIRENGINPNQISEVLISKGPGQYTGLRIGAAGVKGLLMHKKTELYTIGTLEGFAASLSGRKGLNGKIHAVIDARREHLYYQQFHVLEDSIRADKASIQKIIDIESVIHVGDTVIGTGLDRLSHYQNEEINFLNFNHISAKNLIHARNDTRFNPFFRLSDPAGFEPVYLTTRQVNNTEIRK